MVIANANKSKASKPPNRALPLKAPPSTSPTPASAVAPLATPPLPFKRLTTEEMVERHQSGLCFNCDKPFTHGHKCKLLFDITSINDYDADDIDNNLLMMIGTT